MSIGYYCFGSLDQSCASTFMNFNCLFSRNSSKFKMAAVCRSLWPLAKNSASTRAFSNSVRLYSQKPPTPPEPLVKLEVDDKSGTIFLFKHNVFGFRPVYYWRPEAPCMYLPGVAVVTMDRAPVNSLNTELLAQLGETIKALEENKSRGMILTSVCEKSHMVYGACSGLDYF